MTLTDHVIRPNLINFLNAKASKPRKIIEELHVHKGNAIADVVTVHNEAHCYEIKGETDNIYRLKKQGYFYNLVFNKISLVTTENKLSQALKNAPNFWGIIVAFIRDGRVIFRHVRAAKPNRTFDKNSALLTLWKNEMIELNEQFELNVNCKHNKRIVANELSVKLNKMQILQSVANFLACRQYQAT